MNKFDNFSVSQLETRFVSELGVEDFRMSRTRDSRRWVASAMVPVNQREALVPFAPTFTSVAFESTSWGLAVTGLLGCIERYYLDGVAAGV